jgi:Terminase large subunit, T4likevirus-type, N-terminal
MRAALLRRLERIEVRLRADRGGPGRLAILEQIDRSRRHALAPADRIVIDWVETLQGDWWGRERIVAAMAAPEEGLAGQAAGPPTRHPQILVRGPQAKVILSDKRFRVLVAGRRFGKTQVALIELLRAARGPGRVAWYVAPTNKQAKHIAWKRLKELVRPYGSLRIYETDLRIEFPWQATIAVRGAEHYDGLRGDGLDFLVLDEYATMKPEAWSEVLRPALADRMGRALFIGTPKGHNHFYDLYEAASDREDWARFQFTTAEGGNVSREELAAAARELDEHTHRQEFLATFENLSTGRVYYAFSREDNLRPVPYDPKLPISWSLDFNVNPMCSVIGQIEEDFSPAHFDYFTLQNRDEKRIKTLRILGELWIPNSNTADACQEFANRIDPYLDRTPNLMVKIYGDASGSARQTAGSAGSKSDWEIVRREMQRLRIRASFHYKTSNPGVKDRVAAVNSLLKSTSGEIRLFIDPKCKHLMKDLERVVWKSGTALLEKDKDPELTHISDALGYLVETEAGLRTPGGFMPDRIV